MWMLKSGGTRSAVVLPLSVLLSSQPRVCCGLHAIRALVGPHSSHRGDGYTAPQGQNPDGPGRCVTRMKTSALVTSAVLVPLADRFVTDVVDTASSD
jgi:hypothetical protein